MKTITLYKIYPTLQSNGKYSYMLDIPPEDTIYEQVEYELPDGYEVEMSNAGDYQIYGDNDEPCAIIGDRTGRIVTLISSDGSVRLHRASPNGSRLRQLRTDAGLTQIDLADASDVSVRQIQRYESGDLDVGNMTLSNAIDIAHALGCRAEDLIG